MKRIITIMLLAAISLTGFARKEKAVSSAELMGVINEFRGCEGIDIVKLGPVATAAVKSLVRMGISTDLDPEEREILSVMSGLKRIAVVDYSDCSKYVRDNMNARLKSVLEGVDLLVEVKDDDSQMKIYGVVDENASKVRNFVLYDEADCALICLFGTISMDAVARIAAQQ